jgi:MarR family transcriptional regulator, organic hydroperoxide resistance regulator
MKKPSTAPDRVTLVASDVDQRFRAAYWRAVRELDTIRLQQWERFHLTLPQLRVLFYIQRSPGVTTAELSRAMGITVSTTSGLVAKLADAGLVVRGQGAGDRRQIPLELTDAGRAQAGDLAQFAQPFLDRLAGALGADLEQVTAALDRLSEAAAEAREEVGAEVQSNAP